MSNGSIGELEAQLAEDNERHERRYALLMEKYELEIKTAQEYADGLKKQVRDMRSAITSLENLVSVLKQRIAAYEERA